MAWSLGALTFSGREVPKVAGSEFNEAAIQRWSEFEPIGYSGTILTYISTAAKRHQVRCLLSTVTKDTLVGIYNARAAVAWITAYVASPGVSVIVRELIAQKNEFSAGLSGIWECEFTLVEQ
jgi:hypothetical protein